MMDMKDTVIGVVGGGVVGHATARSYVEHVREVRVYDTDPTRATHDMPSAVHDADITFVCLPTPAKADGSCDVQAVHSFFNAVTHNWTADAPIRRHNFVLKSTVPVGYTRSLARDFRLTNLVHSPEFLTARCAVVDASLPSRNVIGWSRERQWGEGTAVQALENLYKARWPHVPVLNMTSDESEAVKLVQNSFFAVKVAFWNEAQEFCVKAGLDFGAVRAAILADGRIHPSHTQVPGPDGKYGFGGACLPKDLLNLRACMRDAGTPPIVSLAAEARNYKDRGRS